MLFSDLHIDFSYTEGNNANCGGIACCKKEDGKALAKEDEAGAWGNNHCDTPKQTVESMLEFINDEIKPDIALWGGDSVPHNMDSNSFDGNLDILLKATSLV